jgi:hypothetical protein
VNDNLASRDAESIGSRETVSEVGGKGGEERGSNVSAILFHSPLILRASDEIVKLRYIFTLYLKESECRVKP